MPSPPWTVLPGSDTYVLMNEERLFWVSKTRVSEEYPDAWKFTSIAKARKAAKEAGDMAIIVNYGTDDEGVVESPYSFSRMGAIEEALSVAIDNLGVPYEEALSKSVHIHRRGGERDRAWNFKKIAEDILKVREAALKVFSSSEIDARS